MSTKITLSAIAKRANLSISSVSRVLRTPQITSSATQKDVYEAIESLNLKPSDLFNSYQYAAPMKTVLILDNQLFQQQALCHAIDASLKQRGYMMIYSRLLPNKNSDIYMLICYIINQKFTAILVINDAPYLEDLHRYNHILPPIVLINHFSLAFPSIYFDHLAIGFQITESVIKRGHKNIAFILGKEDKISTKQLIKGYEQALLRANITVNKSYIITNCIDYHHGKEAINRLMTISQTLTALIIADTICLNSADKQYHNLPSSAHNHVYGAIAACRERDIVIPEKLSLIYFNHHGEKQHNELDQLSEVNKPLATMGEQAVNLLDDLLQSKGKNITVNQQIAAKTIFRYANE
ncbi:LacI family DNA-binding transcriptional regulator [Orbaceae bacterium ESL0721]|nr:LacI family DNA-binding transcriptional regulator [Orbaceae bacterium ESL0721]